MKPFISLDWYVKIGQWQHAPLKICKSWYQSLVKSQHFIKILIWNIPLSHCAKDLLVVKKTYPNLFPSKIIPIWWVHLNSKTEIESCYCTWDLGRIWHLQRKSWCFIVINIWQLMAIVLILREVAQTSSKKQQSYVIRQELYHQILSKIAKLSLTPKINDNSQILI